jgi:hypothetical protein
MGNTKGEVCPKLKLSITRREGRIRMAKCCNMLGNPEFYALIQQMRCFDVQRVQTERVPSIRSQKTTILPPR